MLLLLLGVLIYFDSRDGDTRRIALYILFGFIFIAAIWGRTTWYFSNTTSDTHALHNQQSELSNGCEQTITVMEANGNVVYSYSGKIVMETDNETDYILFDDESGERHIIYKGATQMILIEDN